MQKYTVTKKLNDKRHNSRIIEAYDRYDAAVKSASFGAVGDLFVVSECPSETIFIVTQNLELSLAEESTREENE